MADADEERLAKLWDAYKAQEQELRDARQKIERLEHSLSERSSGAAAAEARFDAKAKEAAEMGRRVEELETRVREIEAERDALKNLEQYRDRVDELTLAYERERERLAKLFVVYEETEAERNDLLKRVEGAKSASG